MPKNKLTAITSTFVPINIENIDTDQIIPARFLKGTTRDGFGVNLFRDWRYENDDVNRKGKFLSQEKTLDVVLPVSMPLGLFWMQDFK